MKYVIVYRTGGTENFKWRRTLPFYGHPMKAQEHCEEVRHMGYPAFVQDFDTSLSTGLPETFAPPVNQG